MTDKDNEENMRHPPDWMRPIDERILEYLRDEPVGTPNTIGKTLGKHRNYVGERCRVLVEAGLLEKPARGTYIIADDGRGYLDEEIPGSELEDRISDK